MQLTVVVPLDMQSTVVVPLDMQSTMVVALDMQSTMVVALDMQSTIETPQLRPWALFIAKKATTKKLTRIILQCIIPWTKKHIYIQ